MIAAIEVVRPSYDPQSMADDFWFGGSPMTQEDVELLQRIKQRQRDRELDVATEIGKRKDGV